MTTRNENDNARSTFRQSIRKVIPVRASVFERKHQELAKSLSAIQGDLGSLLSLREHDRHAQNIKLEHLDKQINALAKQIAEVSQQLANLGDLGHQQNNNLQLLIERSREQSKHQRENFWELEGIQREAIWADVFSQITSTPAKWLKDTSFAPGRWAVGFPFLYAMYRILDEFKPKHILELGLGQSTKMIGQYADFYPDVAHDVVEHDESWVNFWKASSPSFGNTTVHLLDLVCLPHPRASHNVRRYKGFADSFKNGKYDFISVDAPFGYDMKDLSRIDVLDLIPNSLEKSFAIIVDDCNRSGEQGTVSLIENTLSEANIEFEKGLYRGEKHTVVIASKDSAFLCSM